MERYPHIPGFVISELSNNPDRLVTTIGYLNIDIQAVFNAIEVEVKKKTIIPIEPSDLIINVLALCIFPIIAKPMVKGIIFQGSEVEYKNMIERRKKEVAQFVISAIKIKD